MFCSFVPALLVGALLGPQDGPAILRSAVQVPLEGARRMLIAAEVEPPGPGWRFEGPVEGLREQYSFEEIENPSAWSTRVHVLGLREDEAGDAVELRFRGPRDERRTVSVPLRGLPVGGRDQVEAWVSLRSLAWHSYSSEERLPMQILFDARCEDLYGVSAPSAPRAARNSNANVTNVFALLGGQPAMRETLQLQLIGTLRPDPGAREIPLSQVETLEVASHPFAEMLGDRKIDVPTLLLEVPEDRGVVHLRDPSAALRWIDHGSPWMQQFGALVVGNDLDYDLVGRSCRSLGVDERFVRALIESKVVREMALTIPDFFFVDGTDLTALLTVQRGATLDALLAFGKIEEGVLREMAVPGRPSSWWFLHGDRLAISTSRTEIERSIALRRSGGEGSLGASAEYRYMLSQLPGRDSTQATAYLSDSFLRRLTGPEVKIGQFRRANEAARMHTLLAARLLYERDGHREPATNERLIELRYLPVDFAGTDLRFDAAGRVQSPRWGSLDQLRPLSANPVTEVTAMEREAYELYCRDYRRFWRQYYDPIAVRFDELPSGRREVTTFILPLIDSSIYGTLRQFIPDDATGVPLHPPTFDRPPVLSLSAQIAGGAFEQMVLDPFDLGDGLVVDPRIWRALGPQVHLAIWDDVPVLRAGSSEVLGFFGSGSMLGSGDDFVGIAGLLTVLTRPVDLCIDLRDEATVARALASLSVRDRWDEWVRTRVCTVGDLGERVVSIELLGLVKLDFSLRIEGGYLVISNHPFGDRPKVTGARLLPSRGVALEVFPSAVVRGAPASLASLQERERTALFANMGRLEPFLAASACDLDEALTEHRRALGFAPRIAAPMELRWTDHRFQSRYGDPAFPRQDLSEGPVDLLSQLQRVDVSAQLEEGGLRAVIGWEPSPVER